MKNYLSILFTAFVLIISSPSLKASGLDYFAVTDPVGKNGLIIYNFSAPTKFKFEVMFHAETDSYNNILDPKMTFVLVYVKDGVVEEISNEISIPLSSYKKPFIKTDFLKFEAALPANRQGGVIRIRYSYNTNFPKGQEQPNRVTFYNPSSVDCPVPTLAGLPYSGPPPVLGAVPLYLYVNSTDIKRHLSFGLAYEPGYVPHSFVGFVFKSPAAGTVPLHHYLAQNGNNYYTITPGSYGGYTYQGVFCHVYPNQVSKSLPVYSHFNGLSGIHHYKSTPGILSGWDFEDVKFYTLHNSQRSPYPLPEEDCAEFYQYYEPNTTDHFYTTENDISGGYQREKVLGYISTIQKPGTVPLYRYFNKTSDHYYTIVKQDYNLYVYEGIAGYVYDAPGYPGTVPVYSYLALSTGDHYYNTQNDDFGGYIKEGIKFYMLQYNH